MPTRETKRPRGRPAIPREVQRQRLLEFFDSKDDLVVEVVNQQGRWLIDALQTLFEQTDDPLERVDRGLRADLGIFSLPTNDLDRLAGAASERVREARQRYLQEITDMIFRQLSLHHGRGVVSRAPDRLSVELILTGIESLSFRYYAAGRGAELVEFHPTLMAILARVLF